tara:strand:+ start:118 stop:285 length:168 start_codon:yes stop_codon:yes gene_type:complete
MINMKIKAFKLVIDELLSDNYYGAGECTEMAKGKYEYSKGLKVNYRKLKRTLKSK